MHFSRNFYKLLGMPTHLWPSSSLLTVVDSGLRTHLVCLRHCPWTITHRLVSSVVRCRPPLCVTLRQLLLWVPFSNSFSGIPLPTSGLVEDLKLRPLFGFAPKQTKGLSAWQISHIVSQKDKQIPGSYQKSEKAVEHEECSESNCCWCPCKCLQRPGKETGKLEVGKRIDYIQTTALLKSAWILWRVLKTLGDEQSRRLQRKTIGLN